MIEIPVRIESEANQREHWAKKAKRVLQHRLAANWALTASRMAKPLVPCTVKLTRTAPRKLDSDNLSSGFKACRDGVAEWMGIDDGDDRVTWVYAQVTGPPKFYSALVEFFPPTLKGPL